MKKGIQWASLIFVIIFIVVAYKTCRMASGNSTTISKLDSARMDSIKKFSEQLSEDTTISKSRWTIQEEKDKMDGTITKIASLEALNQITFDSPYGLSSFSLNIRRRGKSTDVYLYGNRCQFISSVMGDKTYRIKFDDEKPMNVTASSSTSGGADVVFLGSEQKIISKLKTAKKLIIEAEFYNTGYKTIDFDVTGFTW